MLDLSPHHPYSQVFFFSQGRCPCLLRCFGMSPLPARIGAAQCDVQAGLCHMHSVPNSLACGQCALVYASTISFGSALLYASTIPLEDSCLRCHQVYCILVWCRRFLEGYAFHDVMLYHDVPLHCACSLSNHETLSIL